MSLHFQPAAGLLQPPAGDAFWLLFRGRNLLLAQTSSGLPRSTQLPFAAPAPCHYLGQLDGQPVFTAELAAGLEPGPAFYFQDLRRLLGVLDALHFSLAGRAIQILEWARSHRFCGCCGHATAPHAQGERAYVCPHCQFTSYPRINPCVIVAVGRGEELLLARAHRFNRPMFSTLAGFIEAGESAEDAVHREVLEEVGVRLHSLRYFGSQSWPFPGNLMLGFHAEYAGGELRLQEDEIAEAGFFHYRALPEIPPAGSIANALIQDFVQRQSCR